MVGRLGDLWEWTVLNHQQDGDIVELRALSWNSKVAMPFWLKSKALAWANPE